MVALPERNETCERAPQPLRPGAPATRLMRGLHDAQARAPVALAHFPLAPSIDTQEAQDIYHGVQAVE